ncbi:hypothetical protein P0Y35_02805 [Kiritimatiellaeota bacterium B1221]|nr:hypothetical protein [Kiritimatiellaeota bacterium B1221]
MLKFCDHCQQETLFIPEAVYEGVKKVGENLKCSGCGHLSAHKTAPAAKVDPLAALFGEDAEVEKVSLFDVDAETACLCRKCAHYVIHPFTQRCGLHDREVSATDSCDQWQKA